MKNLGHFHYFLAIDVTQHPKYIVISQKKYIGELLNMVCMVECNSLSTRTKQNLKFTSNEGDEFEDATKYIKLVGSFI